MAYLAVPLMIASTVLTVAGTAQAAQAQAQAGAIQQAASSAEALQHEQIAGLDRASAQREAFEQRRQSRLIESRAVALAAAQGGGVMDPSVINILGDIEAEGEYRALSALFEGETGARTREFAARIGRFEGGQARRAGQVASRGTMYQGLSTAIGQGASLFGRYG